MQVAITEGFKPVVEALLAHNPDVEMEVGIILIYLIPVFKYTHLPTIKVEKVYMKFSSDSSTYIHVLFKSSTIAYTVSNVSNCIVSCS